MVFVPLESDGQSIWWGRIFNLVELSLQCQPSFFGRAAVQNWRKSEKVSLGNDFLSELPPYSVAKSLAKWGTFEFDLATLLTPSSLITIWLHKSRQSCWEVKRLVHFIIWKKGWRLLFEILPILYCQISVKVGDIWIWFGIPHLPPPS